LIFIPDYPLLPDRHVAFKGGFSTATAISGSQTIPKLPAWPVTPSRPTITTRRRPEHPEIHYSLGIGGENLPRLYAANYAKAAALLAPDCGWPRSRSSRSSSDWAGDGEVYPTVSPCEAFDALEKETFGSAVGDEAVFGRIKAFATSSALSETDRATFQAMEALIHNLNTMHSRAGAQVPFSSVNYGTDTSPEGRMVTKNPAGHPAGLGNGETPNFSDPDFPGQGRHQLNPVSQLRPVKNGLQDQRKTAFPQFRLYRRAL
jgi:hypothetical protein